jgi:histone H3/H4
MAESWMKCSACRTEIPFLAKYWQCSVSTCNRNRMRLVFCSVACWDSHLGEARHRDAWAVEERAPSKDAWQRELAAEPERAPTPPARPTPSAGVVTRSGPTQPARPSAMVNQASASTPIPPRPGPIASPAQPQRGPAPTADSVQPARTGPPPPTSDSIQPTRGDAVPRVPASEATQPMYSRTNPVPPAPVRRVVGEASPATAAAVEGVTFSEVTDKDVLIVVSKMKKYIKDRSGMNCSDAVADMLSEHVRVLCDDAIRAAARDERKTVLDRDVTRPRR